MIDQMSDFVPIPVNPVFTIKTFDESKSNEASDSEEEETKTSQ